MPISDIPILSMLRTRMQRHQERQRLLAENVANADTPNYRAHDLAPPDFDRVLRSGARGNAVSHEDEMLKLAGNQMDYEAVTSLSTHSLALLKTALGKS